MKFPHLSHNLLVFLFLPIAVLTINAEISLLQQYPKPNATQVNPDLHLQLIFEETPMIGDQGKIRVYDAADAWLVDELDMSIPAGPIERSPRPNAIYTPEPYVYGPSSLNNSNTKPGTPSGLALPTPDDYQLTIIGGFTDGFHFYPIIVNGNVATIYLHHNLLEYGKTYYVEIDEGVLSTAEGDFKGIKGDKKWVFSTKLNKPSLEEETLVVSADGSGDFDTVQGAMDFIPDHHPKPVEIFIRNGTYQEIVYFRNKSNVALRGEDREKVVVQYANRENFNRHPVNLKTNEAPGTFPSRRSVFMVDHSTGIRLENMTIENLCRRAQAEGLLVNGEEIVVRDTTIIGSGDALQSNGSVYYENCRIEGQGDTILGRGANFFKNCTLVSGGPYMWIRNTQANHGNVFLDCVFDTPEGHETTLARLPTNHGKNYPYSEAVLLNCKLRRIAAEGWGPIGGDPTNVRYWEFNSVDLETGNEVDVSQRNPLSRQLRFPEDREWIELYSDPAFILGDWAANL